MTDVAKCQLCGEPMPAGEEMFNYHGYSGPCPKPPLPKIRSGIELIAEERQRQIDIEGFTPSHDDAHESGELAAAAECYAAFAVDQLMGTVRSTEMVPVHWPWEPEWWKPSVDPLRNLEKAGAIIAAEIDRLKRKG